MLGVHIVSQHFQTVVGGGEHQDEYSIILLNPCKRALENARTGAEGTTVEPRWQYHYNYDGAPTQGNDTHTTQHGLYRTLAANTQRRTTYEMSPMG
jgi:hypothetical protein